MFKKNIWIVGLLAVLAIMFVGCVDAFVDEDGEPTEVFNLQETLASAPLGVIANDAAWTAIFKDTPFMMCGGPSNGEYSIINDGGTKKVKVDKMGPTWGVGFDIYNDGQANNHTAGSFKKGDVLTIKGTAAADGLIINTNTAGEKRLGDKDLGKSFDETFELTADDAANARKGNPKALRIHYKNNNGSERKGAIIIEQITLNGKRKAGDNDAPPPAPDDDDYVPGTAYTPPPDGAGYFYMNLNACLSTSAEVGNNDTEKAGSLVPVSKTVTAAGASFVFTTNNQRIAIKFSEDQLEKIADGGGVKVTITGTATVNGSTVSDSFRYHIGDIKATSNWNASGGNGPDTFANLLAVSSQNFTGNYKTPQSIRHLILNYRGTTATSTDNVTVMITSVKIEPIPAKIATLTITDTQLPTPVAGKAAKGTVDTDAFKGSVTWFPEPPKDRFALSTVYYAKIVLTPNPGYSLPVSSAEIGTPAVSGVNAFYNPETRTLTTANFARTDSKYPPLPAGVFWKMTEWLVDTTGSQPVNHNGNNLWDSRPFQFNDYTLRNEVVVDATNKTVLIPDSARDQDYKGIDIYLTWDELGDGALDPSIYKVEVTVKGKLISNGTVTSLSFVVEESGGSYTKVINKTGLSLPAAGDLAFNYTGEIPENFNTAQNLRIHPSVKDVGFLLEEVSFENKGLR